MRRCGSGIWRSGWVSQEGAASEVALTAPSIGAGKETASAIDGTIPHPIGVAGAVTGTSLAAAAQVAVAAGGSGAQMEEIRNRARRIAANLSAACRLRASGGRSSACVSHLHGR